MVITMRIKEFINNQWVAYADYDNRRSLPHIMDGLKITQRKALYTAISLPKNHKPVKVSQFSAKSAELTSYHHGEASMVSTVVGMAQDYPGSNNYPLLEKHGQFGSRLSSESAAPRYIHTKLHKNWNIFFDEDEQKIVDYLYEDGERIEPKFFIPVVPMLLLNGCDGVGNGFKSSILNYSLVDVVKALDEIVKYDHVITPLVPYINGWNGKINRVDGQTTFEGCIEKINTTKLHISELPPCYNNEKYKKLLNGLMTDKVIKDYENHSTEGKWDWYIDCPRNLLETSHSDLLEKFGLIYKISENFVCWGMDETAPITFQTPEELIEYWYRERIILSMKSLANDIRNIELQIESDTRKMQFVKWCSNNEFKNLSKSDFLSEAISNVDGLTVEHATQLISMPLYRITKDEIANLSREIESLNLEISKLKSQTAVQRFKQNLKKISLG